MIDIEFTTIRGKLKGQKLIVNQICNDWVIANYEDGNYANDGQPISLRNVWIPDSIDRAMLLQMEANKKLGQMFRMYFDIDEFVMTGKFKRLNLSKINEESVKNG